MRKVGADASIILNEHSGERGKRKAPGPGCASIAITSVATTFEAGQ